MSGFIKMDDPIHYWWEWLNGSTLPYNFCAGSAVVLNGEIHILGSYTSGNRTKHYKYSNGQWTSISTLPYDFYYGSAVVLNNEIHILGSDNSDNYTKHYKYSNGQWTSVSTLPYSFSVGSAVVLNDEIHILGGGHSSSNYKNHYKYSNGQWTSVSTLPYNFTQSSAVVLDGEIHILGSVTSPTKHYKYSNGRWASVSTLPYNFYCGSAIVLDEEIHILGGYGSDDDTKHYKYSNGEWTSVSTLPYDFSYGSAVVINKDAHILGSSNANHYKKHYKYAYFEEGGGDPIKKIKRAWISTPTKNIVQREGYDVLQYEKKIVKNAWIGTENGNKLALSSSYFKTISSPLPDYFHNYWKYVEYKGKIYAIGGRLHNLNAGNYPVVKKFYSYDDDNLLWHEEPDPPSSFNPTEGLSWWFFVVYNEKIHLIFWSTASPGLNHYCWDGSSWNQIVTTSTNFTSSNAAHWTDCIAFKPEGVDEERLYLINVQDLIVGLGYIYYTDDSGWQRNVFIKPYTGVDDDFYSSSDFNKPALTVYRNKIHVLGCGQEGWAHCSWDGNNESKWIYEGVDEGVPMPYKARGSFSAITIGDSIHYFGGNPNRADGSNRDGYMIYHYSWNPDRDETVQEDPIDPTGYYTCKGWRREPDLPYFCEGGLTPYGGAVKHKDRIYVITHKDRIINHIATFVDKTFSINPMYYFD